jgi:GDPmannose 4,6-dehydratase
MVNKKIFIFGITGQDGSYLAHYLLSKNFTVYGFTRSKEKSNLQNLIKLKILKKVILFKFTQLNLKFVEKKILKLNPCQIYILSGLSSVAKSFERPIEAYESIIIPVFNILEICRKNNLPIKIYNSSSTDCFGNSKKICNEKTLFNPISPYSKAKAFSHSFVKYYRDFFNINCSSGIASNHESILRPNSFALKKIINYVLNFNSKRKLIMGNTNIYRDWGFAPDFVKAMYKINNSKKRVDYIIATGLSTSLDSIIKKIFSIRGINKKFYVKNFKKHARNREIKKVVCNINKIRSNLHWTPTHKIDDFVPKLLQKELF